MNRSSNKKKYFLLITLIILLDQLTKFIIKSNFKLYEKVEVITGVFQLTHVRNSGVVWGLLSNHNNPLVPIIITGFSLLALIIVGYFFKKVGPECRFELVSLSFIFGGAIGNIIDRVTNGYVVDFLDVFIGSYHWPTFNVADSFITVGVILLVISIWRGKCPQF